MNKLSKYIFLCVLALLAVLPAFATHVRAGEITVKRISATNLTYEITMTTYTDEQNGKPANDQANDVEICFGDGTSAKAKRVSKTDVGNFTIKNIYTIVHTFSAQGTFKITCTIENRNANTLNMNASVNTSFYVETIIVINPVVGVNTTPVLLNPPVNFLAVIGQKWCHNPGAFDAEGDSLAYRKVVCRQASPSNSCAGISVSGYKEPNEIGSGKTENGLLPATYTINLLTGDICWDSPAVQGQYNIAFVVEEWRRAPDGTFIKIGEVVRDMQIIVKDEKNRRPELSSIPDTCVVAGTQLRYNIVATDKDNDPLILTSEGGVYQYAGVGYISPAFATFITPIQPQIGGRAIGAFTWQTGCLHIRNEPYSVVFKAEDQPASISAAKLTDSKAVKITVVAPQPHNLQATGVGSGIVLTWNGYGCPNTGAEMVIYRREGCSTINQTVCQTGIPANSGYIEIGRVPIGITTFTDNNSGLGLKRNIAYSYRIVALFASPLAGNSAASEQTCLTLPRQVPFITNVSVQKTDATQGEILVRWTRPFNIDATTQKAPYQYRLSRATGLSGGTFTPINNAIADLSGTKSDTIFTDKALNTTNNAYQYRLAFYYTNTAGSLVKLDSTEIASCVRLGTTPDIKSVALAWQANVPWSNANQKHRVYREIRNKPNTFNQIAEVSVQDVPTFRYIDDGTDRFTSDGVYNLKLSPDSSYCYRIETVGSYNLPVYPNLLYNFSQVSCATPKDTAKPCSPLLKIEDFACDIFKQITPCETMVFSNKLSWTNPDKSTNGTDCDRELTKYIIYYTRYEGDKFDKIAEINTLPLAQNYTHTNLTSVAGCYYVTAVGKYGTESQRSNVVCRDNCTAYELPNVFTPNNDGKNDAFQPLRCPRFVREVSIVVYNRWGGKVFEHLGDPQINWKGTDLSGNELPSGTYYYDIRITYDRLKKDSEPLIWKGWIELLR